MTKEYLDELKKFTLHGIRGMNRCKEVEPKIKKAKNYKEFRDIMDNYFNWDPRQTILLLDGFIKEITKENHKK